jgi:hypothetical protein
LELDTDHKRGQFIDGNLLRLETFDSGLKTISRLRRDCHQFVHGPRDIEAGGQT